MCAHLKAKEGDVLHFVAEPDGTLRITPYDPTFEPAMKAFEQTRRKYRNALRALAVSRISRAPDRTALQRTAPSGHR
jgi:hypothetical protein